MRHARRPVAQIAAVAVAIVEFLEEEGARRGRGGMPAG